MKQRRSNCDLVVRFLPISCQSHTSPAVHRKCLCASKASTFQRTTSTVLKPASVDHDPCFASVLCLCAPSPFSCLLKQDLPAMLLAATGRKTPAQNLFKKVSLGSTEGRKCTLPKLLPDLFIICKRAIQRHQQIRSDPLHGVNDN